MLVVTRKKGTKIDVVCPDGSVVSFTIIELKGSGVRVGVEAPKEYNIIRDDAVSKRPVVMPEGDNKCASNSQRVNI